MKNYILYPLSVAGAFAGWFLGGFDGFVYALLAFIVVDYITGFLAAAINGNLSSSVGFKGLLKKLFILIFVGMGHLLDVNILQEGSMVRTAVIFFYISNEGLSILENSVCLGLPVPDFLKKTLINFSKKANELNENESTEVMNITEDNEE